MYKSDSIYKYLYQNEKIIWSGRPNYKRVFQNSDLYKIPLSFLFLAILINNTIPDTPIKLGYISFVNSNPNAEGIRSFFIPFIIIAIYLAIGRLFFRAHSLKNTKYYLTNRRLFVYSSALIKTVENVSEEAAYGYWKFSYSRYPVIMKNSIITRESYLNESDVKILYRNIYGEMDLKAQNMGFGVVWRLAGWVVQKWSF